MKGFSTSRKDDLISLAYVIFTLLNKCRFPCSETYRDAYEDPFSEFNESNIFDKFTAIRDLKLKYSLSEMSQKLLSVKEIKHPQGAEIFKQIGTLA